MTNKLAGQKAKFTRAFADYNSTENEGMKEAVTRRKLEVLHEAPGTGFQKRRLPQGEISLPTYNATILWEQAGYATNPTERRSEIEGLIADTSLLAA